MLAATDTKSVNNRGLRIGVGHALDQPFTQRAFRVMGRAAAK